MDNPVLDYLAVEHLDNRLYKENKILKIYFLFQLTNGKPQLLSEWVTTDPTWVSTQFATGLQEPWKKGGHYSYRATRQCPELLYRFILKPPPECHCLSVKHLFILTR